MTGARRALVRLFGGKPVGRRRVLFASIAYAAPYTGVGVGITDLVRLT